MFLGCFSGCSSININKDKIKLEEANAMSSTKTNENKIKPVKLAIFPGGMEIDTYVFDLNSDGILEVKTGTRKSEDLSDPKFVEPTASMNKPLSQSEQENVMKLVYEISNDNMVIEKVLRKGGWEVIILIGDKTYNFSYGDYDDISYGKLVDAMIQYSPLKVDIHGWSQMMLYNNT